MQLRERGVGARELPWIGTPSIHGHLDNAGKMSPLFLPVPIRVAAAGFNFSRASFLRANLSG